MQFLSYQLIFPWKEIHTVYIQWFLSSIQLNKIYYSKTIKFLTFQVLERFFKEIFLSAFSLCCQVFVSYLLTVFYGNLCLCEGLMHIWHVHTQGMAQKVN